MNDQSRLPPFDWDAYDKARSALAVFDDFHLQLTGAREIRSQTLERFLDPDLNRIIGRFGVNRNAFEEVLSYQINDVVNLANDHATAAVTRAAILADQADDLGYIFPEKHWSAFVVRDLNEKGVKIDEIDQGLDASKSFYATTGRQAYVFDQWHRMQLIMGQAKEKFNAASGAAPESSMAQLSPADRSAILVGRQTALAAATLEHAFTQVALLRGALTVAASIAVLPPGTRAHYRYIIKLSVDGVENMLVPASFTLDDAARTRGVAFQSHDLQRPVF